MKQSVNKKFQHTTKYVSNGGFSLIELLISIAILAIIAAPLLNNFVTAARVNAEAKRIQQETTLAQNLVEDIKSKTMEEITREYNYPVMADRKELVKDPVTNIYSEATDINRSCLKKGTMNPLGEPEYEYKIRSGKAYYFVRKKVTADYDALITIDASDYFANIANAKKMPVIKEVNADKNALFIETYQTSSAVAALYSAHLEYCAQKKAENPNFDYYRNINDIENDLTRNVIVNLSKNGTDFVVNVTYEYNCSSIDGVNPTSFPVGEFSIEEPMGDIYLFYYPTNKDTIIFNKDLSFQQDTDVYIVRQEPEPEEAFPSERLIIPNKPMGITLYSNTTYYKDDGSEQGENFVKMEEETRLFDIKVQLYRTRDNYNFDAEDLCAEYSSAKGE